MRGGLFIGGLMLALCASAPGHAADVSAVTSVQGSLDSNIFRIPADLKRQIGKSASDRIATAQGGLMLDMNWQDVRVQGHATAQYMAFARNTDLNNFGYDLGASAAKQGSISSLSFDGSSQRRLTSFQDVRSTARSIQSLTTVHGVTTRSVLGDFRLILGGDYARSTNTDPRISLADYSRYGIRFGFGYYSPIGNVAAVEGRIARSAGLTDSPVTINGGTGFYRSSYVEKSIEAHLLYKPSVLLSFDGRIGIADHRDRSIFHQDFTKPIGDIQLTWTPRPSLQFSIEGRRAFQSSSALLSNGVRTTSARISAMLQVTDRLQLSADYNKVWSNFLVSVTQAGLGAGHKEATGTAEGQLTYDPGGRFAVQLSASHGERTSPDRFYRYEQTQVSISLFARFGAAAYAPPKRS